MLAAGVTYAASSLSTPQVGLSGEPPSAGADLAPARHRDAPPTRHAHRHPAPKPKPKRTATPRPRPTTVPVPTAAPTVDDDNSGERR